MTFVSTAAATKNSDDDHCFDPGPISGCKKRRLRLIFVVALGCFAGVAARLLCLHCVSRDFLLSEAEKQRSITVLIPSRRGDVVDRHHRKLATTVDAMSLYAFPSKISAPRRTAELLAPMLGRSIDDLYKVLTSRRGFVWIQRKVEPEVVKRVKKLNTEGIGWMREPKRSYPKGRLASHILGFVGIDGQGLEGIEFEFDDVLRGLHGSRRVERDAYQRTLIPLTESVEEPSGGNTVVLTIDEVVQHIVDEALDRVYITTNAENAIAIVQDPSTGEILAAACRPDFNPNNYRIYPTASRRNRAVTDAYEPGSCLKIIPTAALLEEQLVDPGEVFYCEQGAFRVHGQIIHDFKPHAYLTFAEVISESSNIAMIKAASRLRREQLYGYCKLFGLGEKTCLTFPGEARGTLRSPAGWSLLSIASIAIGQEVSLTPIQLVRAFSAIANDGIMMKPMLVRQIDDPTGSVIECFDVQQQRRVISRSTAQQLKTLLSKVVEEGSGREAFVPGYRAAGKTGTAQKVDLSSGRYYRDRHVALFCGFVPVEKPRLTILVLVDSPRVEPDTGGRVAAPVFREIAQAALNYLRVPPNKVEDFTAREDSADQIRIAPSKDKLAENNSPGLTMPDLRGLSKLEAVQAVSSLALELSFKGSGHVIWQSLTPNQPVTPGDRCTVIFAKDGSSDETYHVTQAGGGDLRWKSD